jgi:glutathione S-transferase
MKLYLTPGACSLSPNIVAHEAGISLELKKVDLKTKTISGGGDYNKVNPKGSVPLLQLDNGESLTEGPAIVQYLADQKPQSKLMPAAGSLERYRVLEWLNFISSEIHKSFSPLFNPAAAPAWKEAATANLNKRFDHANEHLNNKQYLMGDQFTVADAYLFTVLGWTKYVGLDLSKWPALQAYVERVAARPKVQEAIKAEQSLA